MRDFTWQIFTLTGDIDAYLLYRDFTQIRDVKDQVEEIGSESEE
ncbi:YqzL family protein [Alicyclobacillus tolerans]|uniref:YqzL family protein n=1 Tax=Alicyclobacillus tolerans TaxID=90970 RepID=A0ABT9LT63_9BACL|nr:MULTISPECIES: YqzL family protein [Alicyclobacillus]MDP9727386.1 hypothetical protein [Alicyclobacillus tengchongensis]QRF23121.1 YqzL family protein [Alicyclobacillus sp. TC]